MTKLLEIYRCSVCGNIVEVVFAGAGELVCCGQSMTKMAPNEAEASLEKHIPVIEKTASGLRVTVGSTPHPMEKDHYIEWIEVILENGLLLRCELKPGDKPEATFDINSNKLSVRAYCNLHGLWQDKN
ncbi:MAG: desulfoferrodoxin [Candidatus Berkelbacteria bacterium]|nr:desulfoferrodoxin [Candidatus Berkelbacteria bacterium]